MKTSDISVTVRFEFLIVAVVMLYFGGSALGFFTAVIFHEAGHLISIILLSKCSVSIELTAGGIYIVPTYNSPISKYSEALILISGPAFGLVSGVLLKDILYGLFNSSVVLTVTNLMPIKGTDGGSLLELICERKYNILKPVAEAAIFILAAVLTFIPLVKGKPIQPMWLTAAVMLYMRGKNEKY